MIATNLNTAIIIIMVRNESIIGALLKKKKKEKENKLKGRKEGRKKIMYIDMDGYG